MLEKALELLRAEISMSGRERGEGLAGVNPCYCVGRLGREEQEAEENLSEIYQP